MPTPLSSFRFQDYVHLSHAVGLLIRVVDLDELWTREAQRSPESGNVSELSKVVDENIRLWRDLQQHLPVLVALVDRSGSELQPKYDDLVEGRIEVVRRDGRRTAVFADELRARIRADVDGRGGDDLAVLVRQAFDTADELLDRECDLLRSEFARITAGARSDGDMSDEMENFVHILAIMVAAETGPIGGLVVEGVAALLDWLFG